MLAAIYLDSLTQRLAPVTSIMRVGWPGFRSCLGQAVLSLCVASVHRAGCLAMI